MDNLTNGLTDNHVSQKERLKDRQTEQLRQTCSLIGKLSYILVYRELPFIHMILVQYIACLTYQTQSNLSK